jgi:hypothetical protein
MNSTAAERCILAAEMDDDVERPFYFKCYDQVIGVAYDVKDLHREMRRLAQQDPAALEYHLREGHIVAWLYSVDEVELGKKLEGVKSVEKAVEILEKHGQSRTAMRGMHHQVLR